MRISEALKYSDFDITEVWTVPSSSSNTYKEVQTDFYPIPPPPPVLPTAVPVRITSQVASKPSFTLASNERLFKGPFIMPGTYSLMTTPSILSLERILPPKDNQALPIKSEGEGEICTPECCICYTSNKLVISKCEHLCCERCWKAWIPKHHSCPICREKLTVRNARKLPISRSRGIRKPRRSPKHP